MYRLLASLKIWQKALLPLALCALVAVGLCAKLLIAKQAADAEYTALVEQKSPAATWATRMGASVIDLSRLTWRSFGDSTADAAEERRQLDALLTQFRERATRTRTLLTDSAFSSRVAGYQQRFEALHTVALNAMALEQTGKGTEAVALLQASFNQPFATLRQDLVTFADDILAEAEAAGTRLSAEAAATQREAILVVSVSLALVILLGVWSP